MHIFTTDIIFIAIVITFVAILINSLLSKRTHEVSKQFVDNNKRKICTNNKDLEEICATFLPRTKTTIA
mgnify:CR=1 FL=1